MASCTVLGFFLVVVLIQVTLATQVAPPTTVRREEMRPPPATPKSPSPSPSLNARGLTEINHIHRHGRGLFEMNGPVSRVVSALLNMAIQAAAGNHAPTAARQPYSSPTPMPPPTSTAASGGRLTDMLTAALHLLGLRAQSLSAVAVNGVIFIAQMIANAFAIPTPTPTTYYPPQRKQKKHPNGGKRRGPDQTQEQGQVQQGQVQQGQLQQAQSKRRRQGSNQNRKPVSSQKPDEQGHTWTRPALNQGPTHKQGQHLQQEERHVPIRGGNQGFANRLGFLQGFAREATTKEEDSYEEGIGAPGFGDYTKGEEEGGFGDAGEEPEYEDPDGPDLLQWLMMEQKRSGKGRALVEEASRPGLGSRVAAAIPSSAPCIRLLVCTLAPVVTAMQRALAPAFATQPGDETGNYSLPRAATLARAADQCETRYSQCKPLDSY